MSIYLPSGRSIAAIVSGSLNVVRTSVIRGDVVCKSRETWRSQPVDATPSDLDHFSEVLCMRQARRHGLAAEQKPDIWRLWKAGESLGMHERLQIPRRPRYTAPLAVLEL